MFLAKLGEAVRNTEDNLARHRFNDAALAMYDFMWHHYCDWYVEYSKSVFRGEDAQRKQEVEQVMHYVFSNAIRLLHPFIPFITEELWQLLGYGAPGTFIEDAHLENASQLASAPSLHGLALDHAQIAAVQSLKVFVSQARALKAEHNLASRRDVKFSVIAGDREWAVLAASAAKVNRLAGAAELVRRDAVAGAPAVVTALGTLYLDLASTVDVGAERARLAKELAALTKHIAGTETRLANPAFVGKAPPAVLAGARQQLAEQQAKRGELERLLQTLG